MGQLIHCFLQEATTSKVSQYTTCTPSSRWPTISEVSTSFYLYVYEAKIPLMKLIVESLKNLQFFFKFDTNEEPDISTHTELLQMLGTKKTTEGELSSTQNVSITLLQ